MLLLCSCELWGLGGPRRSDFPALPRVCTAPSPLPCSFLFSQDPSCSFCCRLSTKDGPFHLSVCHAMMFAGWDQDFVCHAAIWVALCVRPAPRPAPCHVPCPAPRSASRPASCLVLCSCPCVSFSHLPWLHSRSSASCLVSIVVALMRALSSLGGVHDCSVLGPGPCSGAGVCMCAYTKLAPRR